MGEGFSVYELIKKDEAVQTLYRHLSGSPDISAAQATDALETVEDGMYRAKHPKEIIAAARHVLQATVDHLPSSAEKPRQKNAIWSRRRVQSASFAVETWFDNAPRLETPLERAQSSIALAAHIPLLPIKIRAGYANEFTNRAFQNAAAELSSMSLEQRAKLLIPILALGTAPVGIRTDQNEHLAILQGTIAQLGRDVKLLPAKTLEQMKEAIVTGENFSNAKGIRTQVLQMLDEGLSVPGQQPIRSKHTLSLVVSDAPHS